MSVTAVLRLNLVQPIIPRDCRQQSDRRFILEVFSTSAFGAVAPGHRHVQRRLIYRLNADRHAIVIEGKARVAQR
jgi:hypothetical protein